MRLHGVLIFSAFLFSAALFADSQSIGPYANYWKDQAGVNQADAGDVKLVKTVAELSSGFLFQHAATPSSSSNNVYALDGGRTSEEMLKDLDGGSCGTFALSAAAILRAGGIKSDDIRIIGGVNATDYVQECPGAVGDKRKSPSHFGASGHVFVLIKLSQGWLLVNTTHDPLMQPIHSDKDSPALQTFHSLAEGCRQRFKVFGQPDATTEQGQKFLKCYAEAKQEGARRLTLNDLELNPFVSPDELGKEMAKGPVSLPVEKFPSLASWMHTSKIPPAMIAFQSWKFEDYPKHTFQDRLNMIASGNAHDGGCRWGADSVKALIKTAPVTGPSEQKNSSAGTAR